MLIRKTAGFFLAALLLAASALGIVAAFPSRGAAADAPATLTTDNASLFLPETYEQYLALKEPADVALSDSYIAIADGKTLYTYDRAEKSYTKTELQEGGDTITKIGFAGDRLFVSARGIGGNQFYEYDFEADASDRLQKFDFNCATFCISGETLYAATVGGSDTTIASYSIADLKPESSKAHSLGALKDKNTTPSMTLLGGTLYCTVGYIVYYNDLGANETFNDGKCFYLSESPVDARNVKSTCAHEGAFYYTASDGLYRATFSPTHKAEEAVLVLADNNLGALTSFGGSLYAVKEKAVCRIDFDGGEATLSDYEISAASASTNRLDDAGECVRAGNLLVTADKGNDRISVYDTAEKRFVTLECTGVKSVATDGTIIAAATEEGISIFESVYESESHGFVLKKTKEFTQNNVVGVVCVYDAIYYVTGDYYYKKIARDDKGTAGNEDDDWAEASSTQRMNAIPKAITADLFGDIYVAVNDGKVYEFSEDDFTVGNELGTPVTTITGGFSSLRAGFDGKLYYLDESGKFCVNDGESVTVNGADFVYTDEDCKQPVSFALGYEDDEVYFCFGDFIVKSNAGALGLSLFGQLSDAKDIVRKGNLLVTADTGNNRVTVYDMKKHSFTVIETDFSPALVATDGSVIAAANGNKVYVCNYGDECFGEPTTADLGTIKGLACVNGTAYYITEYGYGKVEEEDKGLVSRLEDPLVALAADDNGILYVVDTSGHVRYYYEDEFADFNVPSGGYTGLCLNTPISSLQADSAGNLYYLSENALWKNDKKLTEFGNNSLGYGGESCPVAFALDFEIDDVYLLYGNYIVRTKPEALGILTLTDIYDIYLQTLPIGDDKRQPPVGIKKSFGKNSRI